MNTITFLILLLIFVVILAMSLFITELKYRLAFYLIVALGGLNILCMYLSVIYYIKLRNEEGIQGPRGPMGPRGPRGESGKCSFSEKCGIDNPRQKLLSIATEMFEIPANCINTPTMKTCKNANLVEQANTINKQIKMLENLANTTQMSERDFLDKAGVCLSDPDACT